MKSHYWQPGVHYSQRKNMLKLNDINLCNVDLDGLKAIYKYLPVIETIIGSVIHPCPYKVIQSIKTIKYTEITLVPFRKIILKKEP
jgi:hypothetical protein